MSNLVRAWKRATWAHGADPQRQDEERYRDDGMQAAVVRRVFGWFPGWSWSVTVCGFADTKAAAQAAADDYLRALGEDVERPMEDSDDT